ncbi:MAG: glycosyltransferase family 2 protein [Myxococcota bacterium]
MITTVVAGVSLFLGCLVLPITTYLGFLAILARRTRDPSYASPSLRFAVVIPAHNEENDIQKTVHSLLAVDYPEALRDVVVVADNCTDQTAARAKQAGARVLERSDAGKRGKGYALEYAFEILLKESTCDAVVVVDADTLVSSNLLRAYAHRLLAGEHAVQAEYGVSNPMASWRTRLMTIALAMFHQTRSLARERLGVSVGLRGNGMCFSTDLLRQIPHRSYGLVEDVEYGIAMGKAGYRVCYAYEAEVLGEMVSGAQPLQANAAAGKRVALPSPAKRFLPSLLLRYDSAAVSPSIWRWIYWCHL